jgi:hypothetical protein
MIDKVILMCINFRIKILLTLLLCVFAGQNSFAQLPPQMKYKVIVADEGNGKVHYINLANPTERWSITTANRDLQLIGSDRLMVSVSDGYSEYNVKTGGFIKKVTTGSGVQSVFRINQKSTFIGTDNPASIKEVDSTGKQIKKINFALNASIRIVRPTQAGTFLVGGKVAGIMYECDSAGTIKWEAQAGGEPYMALRLSNGNTLISTGYGCQMVLVDSKANVLKKFPTAADKNGNQFWNQAAPNFFAGFQVLKNGNIVVSNWEGHGGSNGGKGYQLIEIDSGLTKVISYWKQDASIVSSLHGVLIIDSIDTKLLHSDIGGILAPVTPTVAVSYDIKHRSPNVYLENTPFQTETLSRMFGLDGKSINKFSNHPASGVYVHQKGMIKELSKIGIR